MSVHARTGGVWRTIKNIQMRTGGVWRMQKNLEVRTAGVWRNLRPTPYTSLTAGIGSPDGKLNYYGYGNGTGPFATWVTGSFGSLGSPNFFGGHQIIGCYWLSGGTTMTVVLGTASLGSTFIGSATYGAVASNGTAPTYYTATGYSQYAFTMASALGTSSAILTLTGP